MSLLPLDPANLPTCNIVIEKSGEEEIVCNSPATQMISLVDPDDQSKIMAVVLVCEKHDQALENGKALIVVSEDRSERIIVQYKSKEEII